MWLADLGKRYRIRSDVGAIFTQEQKIDLGSFTRNYKPLEPWLNAGVFLVHNSAAGRLLFDAWEAAGKHIAKYTKSCYLMSKWPGEQAVVTELLRPGVYPKARTPEMERHRLYINKTVAAVDMVEFNSPWGRFVLHAWGYNDFRREVDYWDGLVRIKADSLTRLTILLGLMRRHMEVWSPDKSVLAPPLRGEFAAAAAAEPGKPPKAWDPRKKRDERRKAREAAGLGKPKAKSTEL
mmetsp:Transcript_99994/g.223414  ORF Transcript_99994/g.223414 Transcript_99994/m.223414 type:complete len:236 (+) Transcript_99994:1-708(+)